MESIAHIREKDGKIQSVEEHLHEVRELSENFGNKLGVKHITGLAGMLHDLGKFSQEFVTYIKKAVYNPENAPKRGSVDHSTAGGKLLFNILHVGKKELYGKLLAEIVGNAIISHHSYLHDYLSPTRVDSPFIKRVREKKVTNYIQTEKMFFERVMSKDAFKDYVNQAIEELKHYLYKTDSNSLYFNVTFLTKFVFSCLIDADRLNTRFFMNAKHNDYKNELHVQQLFEEFYNRLLLKLKELEEENTSQSKINILRKEMSERCEEFSEKPTGIYTLSIPTGGGKTLASFRYALSHALKYDKKRIIYVVPYTTIIEQNANTIRDIIQSNEHLLEHHSNVLNDVTEGDLYAKERNKKVLLAKDNWDIPIIFTTMVQFLNVLFKNSTQNIRRLHNLAESVIIFDEIQKVPVHSISLFNRAVNFLSKFGDSSVLLCTATQPALEHVEHYLDIEHEDHEVIDNLPEVSKDFKRVEIVDLATEKRFDQNALTKFIQEEIECKTSVLIILNTKSVVRDLYKTLKKQIHNEISLYHLSTSMCAAHRTDVLEKVRRDLKKKRKVICISTQLIEAGVDISFESVIRSLAGLDSLAQAAGRCNRHGEFGIRQVFVIDYKEEKLTNLKEIKHGKEITKRMLIDLKQDPGAHGGYLLSQQAMEFYFLNFYKKLEYELDYPIPNLGTNHSKLLGGSTEENELIRSYYKKWKERFPLVLANSYRTSAENFKVIENPTTSVLVPYEKGEDFISLFNSFGKIEDLSYELKQSQHYIVNLYDYEIEELKMNRQIVSLQDGLILALKEGAYDEEYGVEIKGDLPLSFHYL